MFACKRTRLWDIRSNLPLEDSRSHRGGERSNHARIDRTGRLRLVRHLAEQTLLFPRVTYRLFGAVQTFSTYSRIVRSDENGPIAATFLIAHSAHAALSLHSASTLPWVAT
jgi:hypothetical protein